MSFTLNGRLVRSLLPGVLLVALGCAGPQAAVAPQAAAVAPVVAFYGAGLMVPVVGVAPDQVPDTFWAPRSGGRLHQASDILAARGTPVLAAGDGVIVRVGQNRLGGNIIYAIDVAGRYVYYYAHLDGFTAELREGQLVRQGEILGYVGSTGNAAAGAPHLHFQLMRRPEDGSIHGGEPIDPRPLFTLVGRQP